MFPEVGNKLYDMVRTIAITGNIWLRKAKVICEYYLTFIKSELVTIIILML